MASYARTFLDDKFIKLTWQYRDYTPTGTLAFTSANFDSLASKGTYIFRLDTPTPNFFERLKMGEVILNDYDYTKLRNTSQDKTYFHGIHPVWGFRVTTGGLCAAFRNIAVTPAWFNTDVENAKSIVLTKAYAKMNAPDWQSLVSVAEFKKTVSLLSGPLHVFYSLTVNYKRKLQEIRKWKRFAKESKSSFAKRVHAGLGSAYLQWRFGWTPLVNDIDNIMKAYAKVMSTTPRPPLQVKRSSQEFRHVYSGSTGGPPAGTNTLWIEYRHAFYRKVSAGVVFSIKEQHLDSETAAATGFRIRDIPGAAWELIPYSFVVDRFVNVGDWIESMIPNPSVEVRGNWVTVKQADVSFNRIVSWTVTPGTAPTMTFKDGGGEFLEEKNNIARRINQPVPSTPTLTVRPLDLTQYLDHFELIIQRIKSLKK